MKKKQIARAVKIIVIIAFISFIIFNIRQAIIRGNQEIEVITGNEYYIGENLEASINVKDKSTKDKIASNLKVYLLDSNHKKIKNFSESFEILDSETGNIELKLPENVTEGKYYLKIYCKSKKGTDVVEQSITLSNSKQNNINVVLDKGIYKPGDNINYRVLITSKKEDVPVQEDVVLSIYDGNENKVYTEKLSTSEFGITSGIFKLANEVNSGTYKINVSTKEKDYSKTFIVNPYITPQFNSEIKTDKDNFIVNDKINISVNSKYFFGEPVKNAKVSLKINDKVEEGLTDSQGNYNFEYVASQKGTLNLIAEVIDDSNYVVEAKKTIYVSEDIFEIEVLPEFNNVIKNIDNDIYFFVKNPDGSGKKAYLNISIGGNLSRQVITDNQGIGILNLSQTDISKNLEYSYYDENDWDDEFLTISDYNKKNRRNEPILNLKVKAQDMDGNNAEKKIALNIEENNGIVLKTDKVKYNEEDDIIITLNSNNEIRNQSIAVCKNGELLKLITTSEEETAINLENNYGLIDIFVLNKKQYSKNIEIQNKRTIFIKPNKKLNIEVTTDKDEYSPKENVNLKVDLKDENGKNIEGALLISGLDEAVLNLADNDLSIDNIKLSLSDIKLTSELDAATMYSNIIDDKSEIALMGMLLKQSKTMPNINNNVFYNYYVKDKYIGSAIFTGVIFILIVLLYLCFKFKGLRNVMKHIFCFMVVFGIISLICRSIGYNFFYYDDYEIKSVILGFILTLIGYITFGVKYVNKILRITYPYLLIAIIVFLTGVIFEFVDKTWIDITILIIEVLILIIPFIIGSILHRKNKHSKIIEKTKNVNGDIIRSIIIIALTALSAVVNEIFAAIVFIALNIIFEIKFRKEDFIQNNNEKIEKDQKVGKGSIIGICLGILVAVIFIIRLINISSVNRIMKNVDIDYNIDDRVYTNDSSSSKSTGSSERAGWVEDAISDTTGFMSESSSSGISSGIESILKGADSFINSEDESKSIIDSESQANTKQEKIEEQSPQSKEDNIRNIFLESLCFIPEAVAKDGNLATNIKLSDNITSWKLQVVGNTKNGRVGFGTKNITVKKDFFVDFTMPANTIVGDEIEIPVTIYNYTENAQDVKIDIENAAWFELKKFVSDITVNSKSTKLVYVPIIIKKAGENSFKVTATQENTQDIVQKTMKTQNIGIEVRNVVSSGSFEKKLSQDIIYNVDAIENTKNLRLKLYPSTISQIVEGLENIFRMPTGCFEQTSSGLYPDVMVLKYMEDNEIINSELKKKALSYISSGYQRILTFEVPGETGGYSLYGHTPANPSLTAYGLMELTDVSKVYEIDSKVTDNMKNYLYKQQKSNGSFNIGSTYYSNHIIQKTDDLTLNTYIIWALSEADSKDSRLEKSIKYLENNINNMTDSYTKALAANAFANASDTKNAKLLIDKLLERIINDNNTYYLKSDIVDCYGSRGNVQDLQTTALTSIALSKTDSNYKANSNLINTIISRKDSYGTWGTTQATILSLKALVEFKEKSNISNQTITIKLNDETKSFDIKEDSLEIYECIFENVPEENHLSINMDKGKIYYEIIEEYNEETEKYKEKSQNKINVTYSLNNNLNVNDKVTENINIKNESGNSIQNGMVEITIPQGFKVQEEFLSKLVTEKKIQKYEYNYSKIYLYLQDTATDEEVKLDIGYRAGYPGKITGGLVRVYDYYNPDVEGMAMPIEININK